MSQLYYQYFGLDKPTEVYQEDLFKTKGVKVVIMDPDDTDLLFGLELVHGVELNKIGFQEFHDWAWENRKTRTMEEVMYNVASTHPKLIELMVSPHGDRKWQRELEEYRRRAKTRYYTEPSYLKGMFI